MMTPKEFLGSYVKEFNAKNVSSLMNMYETGACFVIQPGQVVKGLENIRQSLQQNLWTLNRKRDGGLNVLIKKLGTLLL